AAVFIPKLHARAIEAGPKRESGCGLKLRAGLERGTQVIVRNARREVMDVMVADIAGKPMRDPRQVVVRASRERGSSRVPRLVPRPVRALERMLHVKKPYAQRAREHNRWQLNQ